MSDVRLTEKQYTLLRRYEDGNPHWLALSASEERTLGVLLGANLLADNRDGFHAITPAGLDALAAFRSRHRIPVAS